MATSDLRQRCLDRLAALDLPYGFNSGHLLGAISKLRGKPVEVKSIDTMELRGQTCGWRVELRDKEVIVFAAGTSKMHQYHILAHEVGHILCDHPGLNGDDVPPDVLQAMGIEPAAVLRVSGRCGHSPKDEQEAEVLGTLLRQRMYRETLLPAEQPTGSDARWKAAFTRPIKERRT